MDECFQLCHAVEGHRSAYFGKDVYRKERKLERWPNNRMMVEKNLTLRSAGYAQYRLVTDRRTDGQTDKFSIMDTFYGRRTAYGPTVRR